MYSTGFETKNLSQSVPPQLENKVVGHDVIVARTMRRIYPTGNTDNVTAGGVLNFNIASDSEWLDAQTAVLHMTIVMDASGEYPNTGWRDLIGGALLTCKGQSLIESQEGQNGMDVYNHLRNRLYKSDEEKKVAEIGTGEFRNITSGVPQNYIYNGRSDSLKYEVAIPLMDIVEFFGLERSYLPIMAIPMLLRLNLNTLERSLYRPDGNALQGYTASNIYISSDFLTMDASLDDSFRKMVMEGMVSFFYPSCFIANQSGTGTSISLKTNINATCANAVFVVPSEPPQAPNYITPIASSYLLNATKADLRGFQYQMYVDSRNVFSQPVDNTAEAYVELQKAVANQVEQYQTATPNISAKAFIEGNNNFATSVSCDVRDVACNPLAVNLSRQLSKDSHSGTNLSLTGGRLLFQGEGFDSTNNKTLHMFIQHTRQLVLSASFLQVIR